MPKFRFVSLAFVLMSLAASFAASAAPFAMFWPRNGIWGCLLMNIVI
jgi:hypothetical protein